MQGEINQFAVDGTVTGWFYKPPLSKAAIARVAFDDGTSQRVVADRFRRDLLERGISHGHFGFLLRAPGAVSFGARQATLLDEVTGCVVAVAELAGQPVIQHQSFPLFLHVEDILSYNEEWTCEDLAIHINNLTIAEACVSVGTEIFVERLAQYCFGEFPNEAVMKGFTEALESGTVSPEQVFRAMLQTRKSSGKINRSLPGPYSPEYPFR